ncbi:MAG: LysR family transcriptional regulator [Alphaproteobacteria bacterium]|nr:LysR family transcriptional regulator [Alphaproteobacteria bacterium]
MTLHQQRIFWAVAHARSFTKASKLLGLAQPSLSQQISKLEEDVGTLLFNRNRNQMELTDAGKFLSRKAELILAGVEEATVGLQEFSEGSRGVIAVGALSSIARNLLPQAAHGLARLYPDVEIDVHETAPAEALDLLYGRRLTLAMLATDSIASSSSSFHQTEIFCDPYVLAVPRGIDLAEIDDAEKDLATPERMVLNSTIQFNFGSQHKRRIEEWYQLMLPHYRVVSQTRTYEVALSMVQEGLGVAVVPALAATVGPGRTFDVTLYRTTLPDRQIVALTPSQYVRVQPYASFLKVLRESGQSLGLPSIAPVPPLLEKL